MLVLGLASAGCDSQQDLPKQEATFEELNLALARLEASGRGLPSSVEELTEIPELKGKVIPQVPPGFYIAINYLSKSVTVEVDENFDPSQAEGEIVQGF